MRSTTAIVLGCVEGLAAVLFISVAIRNIISGGSIGLIQFAQFAFLVAIGAWFARMAARNFRAVKPTKEEPT
jgi:hypothetical protein